MMAGEAWEEKSRFLMASGAGQEKMLFSNDWGGAGGGAGQKKMLIPAGR